MILDEIREAFQAEMLRRERAMFEQIFRSIDNPQATTNAFCDEPPLTEVLRAIRRNVSDTRRNVKAEKSLDIHRWPLINVPLPFLRGP